MSERQTSPVIDLTQRDGDLVIRAEARLAAKDVRVEVRDGMLEIRVPLTAFGERSAAGSGDKQRLMDEAWALGAEPPLGALDEKELWDAQKPLISEDRVTSIHLEGYSDEQANEIVEVLGEDASEEAQGGSATGSDDFTAHGGFPERPR
jgi:hypothetical protein